VKRISVYVASKDAQNNLVKMPLAKPFGAMTDEATKTVAPMETTHVDITGLKVSDRQGTLRVEFSLGGYDAAGKFYFNPAFVPGAMTVARVKSQAFWDAHIAGKRTWDYDAILDWLVAQKAIDRATTMFWGIPNLTGDIVTA